MFSIDLYCKHVKARDWLERVTTLGNIIAKEKMLVTSIFSFSNKVFKRLPSKGHYKSAFCSKGLNLIKLHLMLCMDLCFGFGTLLYVCAFFQLYIKVLLVFLVFSSILILSLQHLELAYFSNCDIYFIRI